MVIQQSSSTGRKVSLAMLSSLFVAGGCNYRIDKTNGNDNPLSPTEKAQLSFQKVFDRVIGPKCVSCHDGSTAVVDLRTYESLTAPGILSKVKESVFVRKTMPKGGSLSGEELEILRSWIDMGAPKDAPGQSPGSSPTPTPSPTPVPVPLEPKFESIKANILSKKCASCHSLNGEAKNIPLITLEDLIQSPRELVMPGNPDESGIVIAIERTDGKRMPPPEIGGALSAAEIQAVRVWIQNGARD